MPNMESNTDEMLFDGSENAPSNKMISIVVPAFNEELNLEAFYDAVSKALNKLPHQWEIIIVNDGSRDGSTAILERLHHQDSRVKAICFSRNFGNQMAISAGLEAARGDAVIVMDADLQQPPEMISVLISYWESGVHVVNTIRNYGQEIGFFKKFTSSAFYRMMNMISDVKLQEGVSDFRLMDRAVVNVLNSMSEHSRFIRAQVSWLGFRQITIPYQCNERHAGVPSFSTLKLFSLALDGIIGFSFKPLRLIAVVGILLMGSLLPYGIWALYQYLVLGPKTPGWTSLMMINLFLGGAILFAMGLIGEYIARIYEEVKHRPRYVVQDSFGIIPQVNKASSDQKDATLVEESYPPELAIISFPANSELFARNDVSSVYTMKRQ